MSEQDTSVKPPCTVLYDGECPVCAVYIAASGLAQNPNVKLLDARKEPELVAHHAAAGRMIDETMIVSRNGEAYCGASATEVIAGLATPPTFGGRLLVWFVGRSPWARPLYPLLARGRRMLLRALSRPLIRSAP
jgi:predicted DCC family thiol-disulfide oxidoreductase YuxK